MDDNDPKEGYNKAPIFKGKIMLIGKRTCMFT